MTRDDEMPRAADAPAGTPDGAASSDGAAPASGAASAGGARPSPRRRQARTVVLPTLLGGAVVLALGTQTWANGHSDEALVAGSAVRATGSTLVPLAGALALTAAAAAVVAVTGGRVARWIGAVALLLAGAGAVLAIAWFVADPGTPLAADLAARTGRTSSPAVTASAAWPAWVALVAALLPLASGVAALAQAGRARGLSRRYDAPAVREQAPRREQTLWEQVSQGSVDDDPPRSR